MPNVYRAKGEILHKASKYPPSERRSATEVQKANIRSWAGMPLSMPPKTEGRGDGFDAVVFQRFGSMER